MVTFDVVGKVGGACSNMEELSKGLTHFANPQMLTIQLRKSSTNCGSSAKSLWRSVSMSAGSSPKVEWKLKWSNGAGKSGLSIIWCISITNNVKSNKKITETAQTAKFTDSPLIFGRNLWKGSEKDQNYAERRLANFFERYPDMPYESWRPGDSENVVVFYSIIF